MTFKQFATYLQQLEKTSSRLKMTSQLAELFGKLDKREISSACYLMQGRLVPKYRSLEFGLSVKMVTRGLAKLMAFKQGSAKSHGQKRNLFNEIDHTEIEIELKKQYKRLGDLGLVAANRMKRGKSNGLTINQVHQQLVSIAQETGKGSQERKLASLVQLLNQLDPLSAKYVVRVIIGKLRLGFSTMTMLDGLSWAQTKSKDESKQLEIAYQKKADIGQLAESYLKAQSKNQRAKTLAHYSMKLGVPILPALCQRLDSTKEMVEKMNKVIAEPKYDGLRVQIHVNKKGWSAKKELVSQEQEGQQYLAFTRNLEDVSHMFPELAGAVKKLNCRNGVLDAEAIVYDPKTGRLKAFQETVKRKRKHQVGQAAKELPVRFYVFDLLFYNNKSLVDKPLYQRKEQLSKVLPAGKAVGGRGAVFVFTEHVVSSDPAELSDYHQQQLKQGLEGVVIKKYDSVYRSGRKGWRWVKIKEAEGSHGKLSDTLDCVVLGYYRGRGKRTQFGVGAFLVGVLDKKTNTIKTVAKIGTGLTDDQFKELKRRVDKVEVKKKPNHYQVAKDLEPDVWVRSEIVAEIAADEITKSPIHTAKLALRFPRLVKFRDDKEWEQATTIKELKSLAR